MVLQDQCNYSNQSQQTQPAQWTNQNSKQIACNWRQERENACKQDMIPVFIGRESGANFVIQSAGAVKQNQIALDTQLKTAEITYISDEVRRLRYQMYKADRSSGLR